MKFDDKTDNTVEGYFSIEVIKKDTGEVIDKWEESNKIMLDSKKVMRDAMMGQLGSDGKPLRMNTFALGTRGHDTNVLVPKLFDYTMSDLFSVSESAPIYPITFDENGDIIDEGYDPNLPNSRFVDSTVTVISETGSDTETIVFTFLIPEENANENNGPIIYSDAALYTNQNQDISGTPIDYGSIFAMRTFPGKIKDPTTYFRITWRIIF
jgi:hypothetical protein